MGFTSLLIGLTLLGALATAFTVRFVVRRDAFPVVVLERDGHAEYVDPEDETHAALAGECLRVLTELETFDMDVDPMPAPERRPGQTWVKVLLDPQDPVSVTIRGDTPDMAWRAALIPLGTRRAGPARGEGVVWMGTEEGWLPMRRTVALVRLREMVARRTRSVSLTAAPAPLPAAFVGQAPRPSIQ